MPASRMIAALAVVLALFGSRRVAAEPCPASELSLSTDAVLTTNAASLDSTSLLNRVRFDLTAGTLGLEYCCSLRPTYMFVRDVYEVVGVPAGTPVPLVVELPVSGEVYDAGGCGGSGCGGTFLASIGRGADYAEFRHSPALYGGARSPFSATVQLPLTFVAGEPETLSFELWARRAVGGSHGAWGNGTIRFTGLPDGASIVSCQGFQGLVVPTRRTSWGAVKTIYR